MPKPSYSFLLLFTFVIYSINLNAQQNPSGIKWKSIDTGNYVIIFPEEITPLGQRVANLMVHYEKYNYSSIKTEPRKIPIVLINQYAEPNGFVSFAPFYSHWFTTPASFDSIEWYKGLAIHEGRHMVQANKLKDGGGKGLWRFLFGETGTALFSAIYVPEWFLEGDAVVMETALTKGGRGRIPSFNLWQRAIELSDEKYSYYESYLGSYGSPTPYDDYYRLGYLICSYVRRHYGKEVWNKVLEDTGKYFLFYTFDSSLRHETGRSITELYSDALKEYHSLWKFQQQGLQITDAEISGTVNSSVWESYLYPSLTEDRNLTAVFFSRNKKLSFVKINSDNETKNITQIPMEIASTFINNERILTTGGNYALWRESIPDLRWGYRTFSDLRLLDINTGTTRYISHKKKYTASALSPDGKTAVGIEHQPDLRYYIALIDTASGSEIYREEIINRGYIYDPAISPDGKDIVFSSLSNEGNSLLLFNVETKKIAILIPSANEERIKSPVFYGKYIIYSSDYSGIDNIYAIEIKTKKRYQVTSRPLGAFFPTVRDDILCFNDYSVYGYKAATMSLDQKKWIPIQQVQRRIIDYIKPIVEQELSNDNSDTDNIPDEEYNVKNYYPVLNSINIFQWVPYFNSTSTDLYFSIYSRDVLHTTDIAVSYIHNFNEKQNHGEASLLYSGLFPVISLYGGYGGRAVYLSKESSKNNNEYLTWNEVKGSGDISLPFNFSRGIHTTSFDLGAETGYIKLYEKNRFDYTIYDGMNAEGELNYLYYYLSFSSIAQGALDSVAKGTGAAIDISYTHTPYYGNYRGSLFSTELEIYLPGINDTHGLKLSGSYERIKYGNYIFPEKFLFPRGYDSIRYDGFYKASADYAFPILNFSLNIWKLVYFKRINGDIFYDFGAGRTDNINTYYRSAGFELTAEQVFLSNKYLSLETGLRYSRCFDSDKDAPENNDKNRYEFVIKSAL